jgi:hypothetical protein
MHIGYWWESQKERDHWGDRDVDGWTIFKYILQRDRMGWYGLDWLAQDRDRWRALVGTVINFRVP